MTSKDSEAQLKWSEEGVKRLYLIGIGQGVIIGFFLAWFGLQFV